MVVEAMESDWAHLSDVDYLVARAKSWRGQDSYRAKAWMLTARMMFPDNFSIQFEAYQVEREAGHVVEAAKYFKYLFDHFGTASEARLEPEIRRFVQALPGPNEAGGTTEVLIRIFNHLPDETQKRLLLESAAKCPDSLTYARQFLLAFERYPEVIATYGYNFLSVLVSKCPKEARAGEPLLELLVQEACPRLLSVTQLKLEVAMLHDLLYLTLDYLCANLSDLVARPPSEGDIWATIGGYLEEIGQRMGWSLSEDLNEVVPEVLWQRIHSYSQHNAVKPEGETQDQLFFLASFLFLRSLCHFWREAGLDALVLVEALVSLPAHEANRPKTPPKRRRTTEDERKCPLITVGGRGPVSSGDPTSPLVVAFQRAYRYYDLITGEPALALRFQALKTTSPPLAQFYQDVAHYQGKFSQAAASVKSSHACRDHLKRASLQFGLGDHSAAAESLIEVVASLPTAGSTPQSDSGALLRQVSSIKTRHVHFLPFERASILSYATRILIQILKERTLPASRKADLALGHMLVLLQLVWPEEKDTTLAILEAISQQSSFNYPLFTAYVIQVDFLEEFAYILQDPNSRVALDIAPPSSGSSSLPARRVGTRGANRGEKEEVRATIVKQVARSHEPLDALIVSFLVENRDAVLRCV